MKISTILEKIEENQLFVPAFQREYVWKRDDAKQLIDSLIKQYPTGTMLTWETSNPPELKGPHKYTETQGAVKLLLDGQQRVTTLYMLIRGEIPAYYSPPEIMNDTRGLHVNVDTLELSYYMKTRMENNPYWQSVTDIFQEHVDAFSLENSFKESGRQLDMNELKHLNANINAVKQIVDREFPEQIIPPKATIKEAIDIFYKVNASGVALTEAELALAQISGYWPEARDIFKQKLNQLAEQGYVFKLDFLVYSLLGCMYHLGSDMNRLHGAENLEPVLDESGNTQREGIKKVWDVLDKHVLDYVVNLMRSKAFVDHTDEINSVYALIPIISFCYKKQDSKLPEQQLWRLVKWFYYSQIKRRYVSQLGQKLDQDLRVVHESEKPFEQLLGVIAEERLEILPGDFAGRSISHPLYPLMRWYFKSQGATCFTTGLGLHKNMGASYQLENDHIFPSSELKKHGYSMGNRLKYSLAQELTNRAVLTRTGNRRKSAKSASAYLSEIKELSPGALEKQCIPMNEALWEVDCYEDFLVARRELLAKKLNEYLNSLAIEHEEDYGAASLEELILEGESEQLEFKSSIRWDYQLGTVNKELEKVIAKTVAAFANSEGGSLVIGVDDDGQVLGLENDYGSLNGDRDRFELHLRNILNQNVGQAFVSKFVKVSFPLVAEREICVVEIEPSTTPIILKLKGKTGVDSEKFYVRSGNSSQELSMSEFEQYRGDRF